MRTFSVERGMGEAAEGGAGESTNCYGFGTEYCPRTRKAVLRPFHRTASVCAQSSARFSVGFGAGVHRFHPERLATLP